MGNYTATQRDIINRKKVVDRVVNKHLPYQIRYACSTWRKSSDGEMVQIYRNMTTSSATDIVISEFPDMPKVLDVLHLLPERFYVEGEFENFERYDIVVVPTDMLASMSPQELESFDDMLSIASAKGVEPLFDERDSATPLRCAPGTYEKVHGRFYSYDKAEIQLFDENIVLDEEIAYSFLRFKLVMICRGVYADLVPRRRGKQKKSYKMKAVGRCCEFAELLSCGRDDFSDFKKRAAHETDRATVLLNVKLSEANFPESLRDMYNKISRLEDIAELWRAACADGNKEFKFNFEDIDNGVAPAKMDEIAEALGIDSFFEAWDAGVPVEDITA